MIQFNDIYFNPLTAAEKFHKYKTCYRFETKKIFLHNSHLKSRLINKKNL